MPVDQTSPRFPLEDFDRRPGADTVHPDCPTCHHPWDHHGAGGCLRLCSCSNAQEVGF